MCLGLGVGGGATMEGLGNELLMSAAFEMGFEVRLGFCWWK